jgi:hypothetical protein
VEELPAQDLVQPAQNLVQPLAARQLRMGHMRECCTILSHSSVAGSVAETTTPPLAVSRFLWHAHTGIAHLQATALLLLFLLCRTFTARSAGRITPLPTLTSLTSRSKKGRSWRQRGRSWCRHSETRPQPLSTLAVAHLHTCTSVHLLLEKGHSSSCTLVSFVQAAAGMLLRSITVENQCIPFRLARTEAA